VRFYNLVLAVLVQLLLCIYVSAQENPRAVVRRTYNWALEWNASENHYVTLNDKAYNAALRAHRNDFTQDLYQSLLAVEQKSITNRKNKRYIFWDSYSFTYTQSHQGLDLPVIGAAQGSDERVVVPVSTVAYFRGSQPLAWTVELQKQDARWRISNLYFNKFNLLKELREFVKR
jgi:hypothetical protein